MVPSYSGTPCFVAPLGDFQSFVPLARPMKFATPIGALSGNSVHVILPAVVSMVAVGCDEAAAAGFAAVPALVEDCELVAVCAPAKPVSRIIPRITSAFRMDAP